VFRLNRRAFLFTAASAALAGCATGGAPAGGLVDTHVHFYDPTRPGGVPWPPADDAVLHRPFLPADLRAVAAPLGVTGVIVVEASPWPADNGWLLALAAREPFILGVVGRLEPGRPQFRTELARLAADPLFRGVRLGGTAVRAALDGGAVAADLRELAARGLTLDVLVGPDDFLAAAQLGERIPALPVIVNHQANGPLGREASTAWYLGLQRCHYAPNLHVKISGLVENAVPGTPETALRERIELVWKTLGDDRVLWGSNWPVSLRFAAYADVLAPALAVARTRPRGAAARLLRGNALRVYGVRPR
jgi:predicted TIM-barrel fold metal-dependent hydrolase